MNNKAIALDMLRAKLFAMEIEKQQAELYAKRKSQVGSGGRSEKIRTYNWKDSRCTDHRINTNFPLQTFLSGDLSGMHEKCIADDQEAAMKEMLEERS